MKRLTIFVTVLALLLYYGSTPGFSQRGRGAGGNGPAGGHGAPGLSGKASKPAVDKGSSVESRKGTSGMQGKKIVGDRLAQNTQLSSKLQGLLPAGTNLQDASSGFKNMGQFVAAVHVSHNLNIPFDQLKAKMTGNPPLPLGKAIQELKPNVDAQSEAKKAENQGKKDIKESKAETKRTQKKIQKDEKEAHS
jgi:TPP-dependent 2-oxoacid decarboxylase